MRHVLPVACAGALVVASPALAETLKLTVVAAAPPHVSYVAAFKNKVIPEINKQLAAAGKGLKIEWTQAYGQSLAKFTEVFETVENGIAHVGLILKNFEASKLPLEQVTTIAPFGKYSMAQMVEVDRAMRKRVPELNKTYAKYNQIYLASGVSASQQFFTKFPVKSIDDLKGRKIGASGAFGQWFQGTGAVVVPSSMANSHTDIRNGVYEGYPMNEILGFAYKTYLVAPHLTMVNFGPSNVSGITVNLDTWKKMPDYAKKIFQNAADKYASWIIKADQAKMRKFLGIMKKKGLKTSTMSDAERSRWAKAMPNIAKAWAERLEKRGQPGKKVLAAFIGELKARKIPLGRDWLKD